MATPPGNPKFEPKSPGPVGADVDRLVFLNVDRAEFGAKVVVTGEGELIWDVVNHKVKLEENSGL
jgi:hypothetical protein